MITKYFCNITFCNITGFTINAKLGLVSYLPTELTYLLALIPLPVYKLYGSPAFYSVFLHLTTLVSVSVSSLKPNTHRCRRHDADATQLDS